jgi:hypothetical protein
LALRARFPVFPAGFFAAFPAGFLRAIVIAPMGHAYSQAEQP